MNEKRLRLFPLELKESFAYSWSFFCVSTQPLTQPQRHRKEGEEHVELAYAEQREFF